MRIKPARGCAYNTHLPINEAAVPAGQVCRKRTKVGRSESRIGAAMLELAIVLPILLALLLGIIEMGRVMMLNQVATNATREACRQAVIPGATHSKIVQIVNGYLDAGGVSQQGRQVYVRDAQGNNVQVEQVQSHQPITIEVQLPYAGNTWGFAAIMGQKSLISRASMRRE